MHTEARAISSRLSARNVSWRLEPHYKQTLHEREKLTRAPTPLFQNEVALKDAEGVNVVPSTEIVEEVSLVIAVEPLAHRLIVCLSDVEEPVTIRMQVGVQTEVRTPSRIAVVVQLVPRDLYFEDLGQRVSSRRYLTTLGLSRVRREIHIINAAPRRTQLARLSLG